GPNLPDDKLLTAGDGQRLRHASKQHLPVRIAVGADATLESAYGAARNEAVAMDPHESRPEFLLQPGERFLEQILPVGGAYGDVLELGLEIHHLVERNQHDPRALGHRQEAACGCG